MSNERTAIVILAGLALAFLVGIAEKLQEPLRTLGDSDTGSTISWFVYLVIFAGMFGTYALSGRYGSRETRLNHLVTWIAIFAIVAVLIYRFKS